MNASSSLDVFVIAGEASGDELGRKLIAALRKACGVPLTLRGVGGPGMASEGLTSLFPMSDISLVGFVSVLRHLPLVMRRIDETVRAIVERPPDILVVIDSPDFTHRVARRVRRSLPNLPIVGYVAPTVWAWRPGRAKSMRRWCDHVLALLPFEPDSFAVLSGPPCTYVGHPVVERLTELRPRPDEVARRAAGPPLVLLLPGSREAELSHLMPVFGRSLDMLREAIGPLEAVLPTLPHLRPKVDAELGKWKVKPLVVESDAARHTSFRRARAALAASGTVTLELAVAGVPLVAAYRGTAIESFVVRRLIRVNTVILANLVLREQVVPEFLQDDCVPEKIVPALATLIRDGPERQFQIDRFGSLDMVMEMGAEPPSERAARIVLQTASARALPARNAISDSGYLRREIGT